MDTLDVWFDSGSSWAYLRKLTERALSNLEHDVDSGLVADVYQEGSDQHRGWFQSSLLISAAVRGTAPYKQLVTHGFVLDAEGRKMSKSLGNVIDPNDVTDGKANRAKPLGADVLRLWVASSEYTSDVTLSFNMLGKLRAY